VSIRVVTGDARAYCATDETMISAYCIGGDSSPHIADLTGAVCPAEGAKAVVACLHK